MSVRAHKRIQTRHVEIYLAIKHAISNGVDRDQCIYD